MKSGLLNQSDGAFRFIRTSRTEIKKAKKLKDRRDFETRFFLKLESVLRNVFYNLDHLTGVCPVKKASVIAMRRNLIIISIVIELVSHQEWNTRRYEIRRLTTKRKRARENAYLFKHIHLQLEFWQILYLKICNNLSYESHIVLYCVQMIEQIRLHHLRHSNWVWLSGEPSRKLINLFFFPATGASNW